MEVPETSLLPFAFWLLPMPVLEIESADNCYQQIPPMGIGSPFKTTAARHSPHFLCCERCVVGRVRSLMNG
jgi:hypothetical protein